MPNIHLCFIFDRKLKKIFRTLFLISLLKLLEQKNQELQLSHHVSNMHTNNLEECTPLMIRNNCYRFSRVLPPERLLGSLICLQGIDHTIVFENLLTSLLTAPLVAGNLLELQDSTIALIKSVVNLIDPIFAKHGQLTEFIKIHEYTCVRSTDIDGFIRYNPNGWGLICVFSNKSNRTSSKIAIEDLPSGNYLLKSSKGSNIELSGEALRKGLEINWRGSCELFTFERTSTLS